MRYRQASTPQQDRFDDYGVKTADLVKYGLMAVGVIVVASAIFVWFGMRIDVPAGYFVQVIKKTGDNMTNDMVLASDDSIKGPQSDVLKEGRHFRNPWNWWWGRPVRATVIAAGEVGIVTRLVGDPLPHGGVIAWEKGQKGILKEVLMPGRYYLSDWEYEVEKVPMVRIEAGYTGVVTRLAGKDPYAPKQDDKEPRIPEDPDKFVVKSGERGTQPILLKPGIYKEYSNKYINMVTPIDVRQQKFEMGGEFVVVFPSKDGFDIEVEGIVLWKPNLDKLRKLFVKYVDADDLKKSGGIDNIQRKVILPFARSYLRTNGGNYEAVDYITGTTRIAVQNDVLAALQASCAPEGVDIKSFVIRSTKPPEVIRQQYQRREIAGLEIKRLDMEIITEIGSVVMGQDGKPKLDEKGRPVRSGGKLAKIIQERKKDRETQFGEVRAVVAEAVREAEQYQGVETTIAKRNLEVARINFEAAVDQAAKILAEGTATAAVTVMKNKAEAEAVKAKVLAFTTGEKYAEYQLIMKLAPGINRILSNTEGTFAKLFERFAAMGAKDVTRKK